MAAIRKIVLFFFSNNRACGSHWSILRRHRLERNFENFKASYGVISGETHASYTQGHGILLSFWNHWIAKPLSIGVGIYLENETKYLSL